MSYVRVARCRHVHPTPTQLDLIVGDGKDEHAACLSLAAARLLLLVLNRSVADAQADEDLQRNLH